MRAHFLRAYLLTEIRHVVTQPKEVLLVGFGASLDGDLQLSSAVVDREGALNCEHVFPSDAIIEDDTAIDLEVV